MRLDDCIVGIQDHMDALVDVGVYPPRVAVLPSDASHALP